MQSPAEKYAESLRILVRKQHDGATEMRQAVVLPPRAHQNATFGVGSSLAYID